MELLIYILVAIIAAGAAGAAMWFVATRRAARTAATMGNTQQSTEQLSQQVLQLLTTTQTELARQRETTSSEMARTRDELRQALGDNQQVLQTRLAETNQTINQRLGQAATLFNEINRGLGSVTEFSKDLRNLRDVFQSPKLRGNIGEEVLRELLQQVLPHSSFAMQFKFREGQVVDAIVKTKQGLIPIDSKFPMENFRLLQGGTEDARRMFDRDVKKHVDAISSKYILPGEGTVDFAVMYVPSEAVYYEIVQRSEHLVDYAAERRVYLVSPNTFYYFLKVIMIGLEGARMEELSRQILKMLRSVEQDSRGFGEELAVLTRHVTNAKNASERVAGKFERLTGKLEQAASLDAPVAPVVEATVEATLDLPSSVDVKDRN